jgi:hypothetical protein
LLSGLGDREVGVFVDDLGQFGAQHFDVRRPAAPSDLATLIKLLGRKARTVMRHGHRHGSPLSWGALSSTRPTKLIGKTMSGPARTCEISY